jgi:uncharacterized membrane protein SpoIIM required for sporulation
MHADAFYHARKAEWDALSRLLDRAQSSTDQLTPEDIQTLGRLYRAAASDLALAQRDFPAERVTQYLNGLVGRAHAVIYRSEPLAYRRLVRFVTTGFPRAFRQALPFTLLAALLFILPALISGLLVGLQPETAHWLLPAEVQSLIPSIERQELWTDIPIDERPYASSFIMQNNIRVAFLAFGSGITAGLLTVWVMVMNGLILGGLLGLTSHHGVGFDLGTFVIGHGVVELSVIFIAGGTGLMLGWAILHPGLLRRRDALAVAARRAVRLVVGCVPLLVIAGLIEGFISPNAALPCQGKGAVGLGSGEMLYGHWLLAGRERRAGSV